MQEILSASTARGPPIFVLSSRIQFPGNSTTQDIMVEENPAAKRQRLEEEQRTAYEEDIARVRAAMGGAQHESGIGNSNGMGGGESTAENRNRSDSDAEDGGNWLKKLSTTRRTRIGENYQVTDLPVPSPKKK